MKTENCKSDKVLWEEKIAPFVGVAIFIIVILFGVINEMFLEGKNQGTKVTSALIIGLSFIGALYMSILSKQSRQKKKDQMLMALQKLPLPEALLVIENPKVGLVLGELFDVRNGAKLYSFEPLALTLGSWLIYRLDYRNKVEVDRNNAISNLGQLAHDIVMVFGDRSSSFVDLVSSRHRGNHLFTTLQDKTEEWFRISFNARQEKDILAELQKQRSIVRRGLKTFGVHDSE